MRTVGILGAVVVIVVLYLVVAFLEVPGVGEPWDGFTSCSEEGAIVPCPGANAANASNGAGTATDRVSQEMRQRLQDNDGDNQDGVQQDNGDIWNNWRAAGYGPACAVDGLTNAEVQEMLGVPVVRDSNRSCGWSWNGASVTFSVPDNDWVVIVFDGNEAVMDMGPGTFTARNWEVHYLPGYESGTTAQEILSETTASELSSECDFSEAAVNELFDASNGRAGFNSVDVQVKDEDCAFGQRGGNYLIRVPVDWIATIHPSGDDNSNAGGEDDIVFVWQGDGRTEIAAFAFTLRYEPAYSQRDDIHDICLLWAKEQADGMLNEAPFLVDVGNTGCDIDMETVRRYMNQFRPGSGSELDQRVEEAIASMRGGESVSDASFRG